MIRPSCHSDRPDASASGIAGEPPGFQKGLALKQPIGMIEVQERGCCLADLARPDNPRPDETKMLTPAIRARVEQPAKAPRVWRESGYIGAFEAIAEDACQCEVAFECLSPVLFTDHVFDLATKERVVFVDEAVFAQTLRPIGNQAPQVRRDVATHRLRTDAHGPWPDASGAPVPGSG